MGQITWFSKRWARLPGFAKIWARLPGEKIVKFCKKGTRLPGGPDYLVAAHSGPDYLGAAKSGPDYLDRCFRVFFAVSLPSLVGGKPAGPDYLVAAQSGPDYLGAAKWGADYLEFPLFLAALRPARTLFARTAPPATPRSPGRPRRVVSLWSSRELAPRGRAEAPCSAAPRVSTARAAGGRAVCVAPLWASAWSCAERVGGALTRAPRARTGTRRNPLSSAGCSHPRAHNTLCQAVQHAALVLCCGSRCWPAWLRDGVRRPAWAPAGCTRERRWQRTPDPISFPCRRLAGSAASCDPHSSHCPGSAAPLLVDRPAARHGSTRWSRGDVRSRGSVGTARGSVGELCLGTTSS